MIRAVTIFPFLFVTASAAAADSPVIDTMDALTFTAPKEKGRVELVDGKIGKAILFSLEKDARSAFFTSKIRGEASWDKAAGFSFWVRGDGTNQYGGLELIYDNDYALRYDLCFPIKGKDWTKITVAWDDLIPVLPGPKAKTLGPDSNPPSKITSLMIGKWWYWSDYPPGQFAIDEIRLEEIVERDRNVYRPEGKPLSRVAEKLSAGKPITIVTMGDSLTDTRHHANRKVNWPDLLAKQLKSKYKSEITIHNPAIGGTQLRQNLVLIPPWLDKASEPDLVMIWFGGNDWDAGMRGAEFTSACADAIDRVRRATKGKSDVLLLTTCPAAIRWDTTMELGEACRKAAREQKAGLGDVEAAFRAVGKSDREKLFIDDRVHLSLLGHELVADVIGKAIADQ